MRFDNPIYNHWFRFPDLAEFPDYGNEERRIGKYDITRLYNAVDSGNLNDFLGVMASFTDQNTSWFKKLPLFFNFYQNFKPQSKKGSGSIFEKLYEYGVAQTQVDEFDELKNKLQPKIDAWLEKEDWKPTPGTYDRGEMLDKSYIEYVNTVFAKHGILRAASDYYGNVKEVAGVYLHICTPTDFHYKQFFRDASTVGKFINTHIDPKENVVKAIVYLEKAYLDNGPFRYVPTSNRFMHDPVQNIIGRAITSGNYCETPEQRKSVFMLPRHLRVSHNFGRCIRPGTRIYKDMDDKLRSFTSNNGNTIIFDPGAGMHQGGIVTNGMRINLQVLMK